MVTTFVKPCGGGVCSVKSHPQPTRVPSGLRAKLLLGPAVMEMMFVAFTGTLVWPKSFAPVAVTEPSARKTTVWLPPAAAATALDRPGKSGTGLKEEPPQATVVPSDLTARVIEP